MKSLLSIVALVLLSACGGSKSITQEIPNTPQTPETTVNTPITPKKVTEKVKPAETDTLISEVVTTTETNEVFNHLLWNNLLEDHVSENGNVNYKALSTHKKSIKSYITSLSKNMPNDTWSKNAKLAYWINAYNALTVDLILKNYPIKSIKDIDNPWDQRLWQLGNKWYNLNDIEHKILRKMNEPRIHFGIVCASFSCPKLQNKAFTEANVDKLLTTATKDFIKDDKRNNITANNLKLSKIFKWFSGDFKTNGSLIDFLNKYSDIKISSNAKKSFKDYNWSLNN